MRMNKPPFTWPVDMEESSTQTMILHYPEGHILQAGKGDSGEGPIFGERRGFSVSDSSAPGLHPWSHQGIHLVLLASSAPTLKVVAALIEAKADIRARNCYLWTPLDCAAAYGWIKCATFLINVNIYFFSSFSFHFSFFVPRRDPP